MECFEKLPAWNEILAFGLNTPMNCKISSGNIKLFLTGGSPNSFDSSDGSDSYWGIVRHIPLHSWLVVSGLPQDENFRLLTSCHHKRFSFNFSFNRRHCLVQLNIFLVFLDGSMGNLISNLAKSLQNLCALFPIFFEFLFYYFILLFYFPTSQ